MSKEIEIVIEDEMYDFYMEEARKKNLTFNEYVCQQLSNSYETKKPSSVQEIGLRMLKITQNMEDLICRKN